MMRHYTYLGGNCFADVMTSGVLFKDSVVGVGGITAPSTDATPDSTENIIIIFKVPSRCSVPTHTKLPNNPI